MHFHELMTNIIHVHGYGKNSKSENEAIESLQKHTSWDGILKQAYFARDQSVKIMVGLQMQR